MRPWRSLSFAPIYLCSSWCALTFYEFHFPFSSCNEDLNYLRSCYLLFTFLLCGFVLVPHARTASHTNPPHASAPPVFHLLPLLAYPAFSAPPQPSPITSTRCPVLIHALTFSFSLSPSSLSFSLSRSSHTRWKPIRSSPPTPFTTRNRTSHPSVHPSTFPSPSCDQTSPSPASHSPRCASRTPTARRPPSSCTPASRHQRPQRQRRTRRNRHGSAGMGKDV